MFWRGATTRGAALPPPGPGGRQAGWLNEYLAETRSLGFGVEDGKEDDDDYDGIDDGEGGGDGSGEGPPTSDVRGAAPATTTTTTMTKIAMTHTTTTTILSQTTTISPGGGGGGASPAGGDSGDASPPPMRMAASFLKRSVTPKAGAWSAAKAREGPPSSYEVRRCVRACRETRTWRCGMPNA